MRESALRLAEYCARREGNREGEGSALDGPAQPPLWAANVADVSFLEGLDDRGAVAQGRVTAQAHTTKATAKVALVTVVGMSAYEPAPACSLGCRA